ncbi:Calmodulin-like protein 9 [Tritrichomonas foetus]|uniref:Calmodulin-like protein 9 n=1 Tax=Tritrichomonas foetus TaxID=1144522 RepID=A0A1J4KW54_9EUKA|nr:Calmodulin-like protein 9 [Tritrichomonas foetus]|eukprot:OHT15553.1 Calmodulin-like protein 9 [Tritrichomonas foetus]
MKFTFTEKEIQEMAQQFLDLNTEGNGLLGEEAIDEYLKNVNVNPIFARLGFRLFDLDKDNALTFAEFALFLKGLSLLENDPKEFHQLVFESVDVDDNGQLDPNEFDLYCKLLGIDETAEESKAIVNSLDTEGKGMITFDELYDGLITPLTNKTQ